MRFPDIRALLFDLDGTLVDTAPDLGAAANHVRATQNLPPLPAERYRPSASAGARGMLRVALEIRPEHDDFQRHREAFLDHYGANLARHSRLFDGMPAVLGTLTQRGLRWGVATNKPSRYTRALIAALELRPDCALSADEVARPKPAPDLLLACCERLEVEPRQCLYVGDDRRDIEAGRAAGMKTVAVEWGYEGEHPIASWGADVRITAPADLLSLI